MNNTTPLREGLSEKYKVSINTLRRSLSEYSDEFVPLDTVNRSELEKRLTAAETAIQAIKAKLKKRFNLHI